MEGACYIPENQPLKMTAEVESDVIAVCNDGQISTYSQATGRSADIYATSEARSIRGCYGRSTLYEQFGIDTTWHDVGSTLSYNSSSIYGRSSPYQNWYARPVTQWTKDYNSAYFYQGQIPGPTSQLEGWAGFSTSLGGYVHEHHMIVSFVVPSNRCTATDYFWGTIGNGWWWVVSTHS